jgi:hypothetical protein
MRFTIKVPSRASKQRELLDNLPDWCTLDRNMDPYTYTVRGIYEEALRVHDVCRYVITLHDNGTVSMAPSGGTIGEWHDKDARERSGSHPEQPQEDQRVTSTEPGNSASLACETTAPAQDEIHSPREPCERPSIALLIESPHRHEYDYENGFKPVGPAQGPTGNKIDELLCKLLQDNGALGLPATEYDLLIVNPVQFQASLHRLHRKKLNGNSVVQRLRNHSWRALYALEWLDFWLRMDSYQPCAVLMACTKKLQKDLRRELVEWVSCWQEGNPQWPARPLLFEFSQHPQNWKDDTTLQPVPVPQQPRP